MKKIVLKSGKACIQLESNDHTLIDDFSIGKYLHPLVADATLVKEKPDFSIRFIKSVKSTNKKPSLSSKKFVFQYKTISPYQLVFILLTIFEFLHEKKGTYGLHAAAVTHNKKGVLLLGDGYAGKSTIARILLSKKYNVIGDERILINSAKMCVIGGNNWLTVKKEDYSDNLKPIFTDSKRVFFALPRRKNVASINAGFTVRLGGKNEFDTLSKEDTAIKLFGNINFFMRSEGAVLLDINYPFPSLDNAKLTKKRLRFCKKIASTIPFYRVSGNPQFVEQKIREQLL